MTWRLLARVTLALACTGLLASPARPAGYESLLEQGRFYLSRGATYGTDAVRVLEQARGVAPERAAQDPEWMAALAAAYEATARYTEAYWLLRHLQATAALGPSEEALLDRLLGSSGLGRVRLLCAVTAREVAVSFSPEPGARVDVSARKALERLRELLDRGVELGPEGLVLLLPEGRYALTVASPQVTGGEAPLPVEVWAGDETAVRLLARYPAADQWLAAPGSRSLRLTWPPLDGGVYRLVRLDAAGESTVCRGTEPTCLDTGLGLGEPVPYRLETRDGSGELLAVASARFATLAPVREVAADAQLDGRLRMRIRWVLGEGAADRVRVLRLGPDPALVGELDDPAGLAEGALSDGPFVPAAGARTVTYRVEALVAGFPEPVAAVRVEAEVPPRVVRVAQVGESLTAGAVAVFWETVPREGVADGYAVFRMDRERGWGELVGRVDDPFAREFEYWVDDPLGASEAAHFVVPYLGDRFLLDPERIEVADDPPARGFDARRRKGEPLPDLALHWEPYAGAVRYLVRVGERELWKEAREPYLEISNLQTRLMATEHRVSVAAVDRQGRQIPLVQMQLAYTHYGDAAAAAVRPEAEDPGAQPEAGPGRPEREP